jgi:hypothetical protein
VASWYQNPPDTIDVMVFDIDNYSLFLDGMSFETVLMMNDSEDGYFMLQNLAENLYVVVFYNDQAFGVATNYQVTLVEIHEYTYIGNITPNTILVMSIVGFGVGAVTMAAIAIVLWRMKMRNY